MGNHEDEPPAMNSNVVNGEAEQRGKSNSNPDAPLGNLHFLIKTDKFGVPLYDVDPDEEVNVMPEKNFYSFRRHFPKSEAIDVQESWPTVESALKEYGIACALDLDHCIIRFYSTPTLADNGAPKMRDLLLLLSARVPVHRALRVLEVPYEIIPTGHRVNGAAALYGITRDEYRKRKKRLMNFPVEELEEITGCEIYIRPKNDLVAAIGGSVQATRLVQRIVWDCIGRKVPPRIRGRLKDYLKVFHGVKNLSLQ